MLGGVLHQARQASSAPCPCNRASACRSGITPRSLHRLCAHRSPGAPGLRRVKAVHFVALCCVWCHWRSILSRPWLWLGKPFP